MIYGEQSPGAWRRRRACLTCAGLAAPLQPRIGAKPRLSKHRQQNTQEGCYRQSWSISDTEYVVYKALFSR